MYGIPHTGKSETPHAGEVQKYCREGMWVWIRHPEPGMKKGAFGDGKSRPLIKRSLPCPTDRLKEVISEHLLWARI